MEVAKVTQDGECWAQLSIVRTSKAMDVWVQVDPKVEDFFKSLTGETPHKLEEFGRGGRWSGNDLKVYRIEEDMNGIEYSVNAIGQSLHTGRGNPINLSFLRLVGASKPEGVTFSVTGPVNREAVRELSQRILTGCRSLFKEYIVPVKINLRITSTEL